MKYTFVIAALLFSTTQAIRININEEPAAAPAAEPAKEAATEVKKEAAPEEKKEAAEAKKEAPAEEKKEAKEEKKEAAEGDAKKEAKADPELDKKNAAKAEEATNGPIIPKTSSCTHPHNADCKIDTESASDKPTPAQMR